MNVAKQCDFELDIRRVSEGKYNIGGKMVFIRVSLAFIYFNFILLHIQQHISANNRMARKQEEKFSFRCGRKSPMGKTRQLVGD